MLKIKKFLSILFLVAFTPSVFAQELIYSIDSFDGGQVSHRSPYLTKDNQGVLCQNLRVNDQFGALSKRDPMMLLLDGGTSAITGMHRFYKSDATAKTVFGIADGVFYDASGTATALTTGLSSGERWQFATYKDKMIGWNGVNQPIKWDGKTDATANASGNRTVGELSAQLGAPFAELTSGHANHTANKWYQYKTMFLVAGVTYYSTAKSNPLQMGSTVKGAYLTDIPLGPAGTTARYIYRTTGRDDKAAVLADTDYKLCGTISDNSTVIWEDTMSDATLAGETAWSTSGKYECTPPMAKLGLIHKERLFLARTAADPSYLFWSDAYNPDFFYPDRYEPIRQDDGARITFVKEFRGQLTVGKETAIQSFYTDNTDDTYWYASTPFSFVGCVAPYSVAVTPFGIVYYSNAGIYRYTGQNSVKMSDAVTDQINDISSVDAENTAGYYYGYEYYFAYTSTSAGGSYNDRLLIYDFTRDAYVLDFKNVNCFLAFDAGLDFGALYTGSSDDTGYIYAQKYSASILTVRYKSDLDAGTYDDTYANGDDNLPTLNLGWDCTIDGWLAELQTKDASITSLDSIITYIPAATIDRPDTSGTWTSPIYNLGASAFDRLYWRESLGAYGDVTWQMRVAATEASVPTATWSTAVSDPSGSDVSSVTANSFVQLRANLSTTNIDYGPTLTSYGGYLARLVYNKGGTTMEGNFTSIWDSGWRDLQPKGSWKNLKRIKVFYTGSAGEISLRYYNEDGDVDNTFTIDLTVDGEDSQSDNYTGIGEEKIFTYYCPANENGTNPLSRLWRFVISNTGLDNFKVQKIEIKYEPSEEID